MRDFAPMTEAQYHTEHNVDAPRNLDHATPFDPAAVLAEAARQLARIRPDHDDTIARRIEALNADLDPLNTILGPYGRPAA